MPLAAPALPADPRVVVGLETPDDAAVATHPNGAYVVSTVDFFPPFLDDPYLVGQVGAINAVSDLYAMGAEPRTAMVMVALPAASDTETEETLELLLRGASKKLKEIDVALVGGHTIEGESLLFGLSVNGSCAPDALLRKAGAQPGDLLVLTKALGTGVVLAAARAGTAPASWTEAAIAGMLRANREALSALRRSGVHACTDVTGFGLAGHLLEMLRASGVGAQIDIDALPALPGALELLDAGVRSSFHGRNNQYRKQLRVGIIAAGAPRVELMFDPQTSGGLLAAVPPEGVDELRVALEEAGDGCHVIGRIVAGQSEIELMRGAGENNRSSDAG